MAYSRYVQKKLIEFLLGFTLLLVATSFIYLLWWVSTYYQQVILWCGIGIGIIVILGIIYFLSAEIGRSLYELIADPVWDWWIKFKQDRKYEKQRKLKLKEKRWDR